MRQTTKARHTLGIRGQLMWFLCFICLFLLGLFWLLSTQLLEPLYTKHIETQLTNQADSIVERLDDAIAEGKVLSSWSFGQLAVNSDFFDKLTLELYTKGTLNSFCVDISDTTLHTIYKIENQSFCNLHGTYLSDSANNDKIIATALAMRRKCRSMGSFVQTLNPPRLSGSAQLLVGRTTAGDHQPCARCRGRKGAQHPAAAGGGAHLRLCHVGGVAVQRVVHKAAAPAFQRGAADGAGQLRRAGGQPPQRRAGRPCPGL